VAGPARLLGPDGQPIAVRDLSSEVAFPTPSGARSVHHETVSGYTPERITRALREAGAGRGREYLTLAIEMEERYLHYAAQLQTRRLAFDALPAAVTAPQGTPARIVDAVQRLVAGHGFREMCSDLTDGIGKGYSVVEPIWEHQDGFVLPVAYKHRDPRFFAFDPISLSELRLADDRSAPAAVPLGMEPLSGQWSAGSAGEPLPPGRFIVHMPRTRTGLPIRRGLARAAAFAFLIQTFTLKDWAAFAEVYGIPFRVGRYTPNASEADKLSLLRAVRSIASDGAAIIPAGMDIDFHEVKGSHGAAVFGSLIDYVDKQVSKLVVGQTMTADEGGSLAQAKVHNEVRLDLLRADARQMTATIARDLIRWFVSFNFGPQAQYPSVEFPVAEPEDMTALAQALSLLVPLGLRVAQSEVRDKLGLSEPARDAELLQVPSRAASSPPSPLRQAHAAAAPDLYAAERDEWEPLH